MPKIMSGRNVTSVYRPKVEPVANRANVEGVAQQGAATAFHKKPIIQGRGYEPAAMPATGVPGKYNAKTQGPGSLRTVYHSGAQSHYGPNPSNAVNRSPDPPATGNRGRDILKDYGPERGR